MSVRAMLVNTAASTLKQVEIAGSSYLASMFIRNTFQKPANNIQHENV
jgi:hypothetical protein